MKSVWPALAHGEFLHGARVRIWLSIAAAAAAAMVIFGIATSNGVFDLVGRPLGTDFISFWTASRVAIDGPPDNAWDVIRHGQEQVANFGVGDGYAAFCYPPIYLLMIWPLGYLPYLWGLSVWLATTGLACRQVLSVWCGNWADKWLGLVAFVAYPAFFSTVGHGQNAFLVTALFTTGALLLKTQPISAGVVFGLLSFKPHLAIVVPVVLLASGRWPTLFAMGVSIAALTATSAWLFGIESWVAFFEASEIVRLTLVQELVDSGKMVSVYCTLRMFGLANIWAWAGHFFAAGVVLGSLAWTCRRHPAVDGIIAAGAAATVLISPYLFDYDLMLLAVPMGWVVRRGLATGFAPGEKWMVFAAFVMPGIARPLALGLGVPIAPVVTAALLAVVLRRMWREAAHQQQTAPAEATNRSSAPWGYATSSSGIGLSA